MCLRMFSIPAVLLIEFPYTSAAHNVHITDGAPVEPLERINLQFDNI